MKFRNRVLAITQLLIISLFLMAGNAFALPFGYGIEVDRSLYSIDLTSGSSSLIGPTGIDQLVEGIAMDDGGNLFATDGDGMLYNINSSTGTATLVGDTARGNIEGLDFFGGTLYGVEFSSTLGPQTLFSIDTATGTTTDLVTVSRDDIYLTSSMTIMDSNTALFSGTLLPGSSYLFSVDLTDGTTNLLGDLGEFVGGLDFAEDGSLYGLGSNGHILQIDPNTGGTTIIAATSPSDTWLGLTTYNAAPVPEPTTMILFGVGLVGLAGARRKLRK